ncbi:BON domain-containing protein [Ningiella sp. W23]|uniref:BON domain-containing protein n=1 Tax=Ningiella sp. W23 TaxID=3023715 RepID=UPI0037577419
MKYSILAVVAAAALNTSAYASDHNKNNWTDAALDAWIDGKAEATLLFNGNLDSFDINTDVQNGLVTLTGKVDTQVEKQLAAELIKGIEGVREIENDLSVYDENKDRDTSFIDAKISTVIKSRLLFDSDIAGTDIDVDVENKMVTLNGRVESEAEKDLAVTIAQNADDVEGVTSRLTIESDS